MRFIFIKACSCITRGDPSNSFASQTAMLLFLGPSGRDLLRSVATRRYGSRNSRLHWRSFDKMKPRLISNAPSSADVRSKRTFWSIVASSCVDFISRIALDDRTSVPGIEKDADLAIRRQRVAYATSHSVPRFAPLPPVETHCLLTRHSAIVIRPRITRIRLA
jgi:hypothetical protein